MTKRKTIFNIPYEFFNVTRVKIPVKFPFGKYTWESIFGIQFGNYFIGIIKGSKDGNTR